MRWLSEIYEFEIKILSFFRGGNTVRSEKAFKNIFMGILYQVIIVLLGFISRKVFLDSLGSEYLGINGLLTNVLSSMVLIEGGIGISIVYNLYNPLAKKDTEQIMALVSLYKKAYRVLALIIFLICLGMYPFLPILMKTDNTIPFISLVYWLFVMKSLISYLFAYKWALINADQCGYILTKNNIIYQIITMLSKIIILYFTKNYILFLILEVITVLCQSLYNSHIVTKLYPYITLKQNYKLNVEIKRNIIRNVKAMFLQNIGSYVIFSTDNIIISAFINVKTVGLYSNYTMIIGQLSSLISPIIGGIGNSVGNLIATESKQKSYQIFKITNLVAYFIYSITFIFLFNLVELFITWWLGDGYLLSPFTFTIIMINYYISGMRTPINTFKNKAGLFAQDKYASLIEGVINLFFSILLVKKIGLSGVFLGTTISCLSISFWNQPRILFKEYFKIPVSEYYKDYLTKLGLFIILCIGVTTICSNILLSSLFFTLVLRGIICIITPLAIYIIIYSRTLEMKYLYNTIIVNNNLNKLKLICLKSSILK